MSSGVIYGGGLVEGKVLDDGTMVIGTRRVMAVSMRTNAISGNESLDALQRLCRIAGRESTLAASARSPRLVHTHGMGSLHVEN